MVIGVIDIDNHECMTLGSIQTPDSKTLVGFSFQCIAYGYQLSKSGMQEI